VGLRPSDADEETVIEFLDDVTERPEDRDTLLDHLAHGLMPGHPYRAFVVCYGPGGNGKTQVAELFREFVGGQKGSAAVEIDELTNDDFATGDLPGKFINWGDDMAGDGGGALKDLSLLKKATGGSEIRANEKFEKTFNFKNEAAMFFSANEPPRIGEKKSSIQDRIYPIRMPYRFTSDPDESDPLQKEKTPNISEKLVSDDAVMRGILSLAVKHAQDLIETKASTRSLRARRNVLRSTTRVPTPSSSSVSRPSHPRLESTVFGRTTPTGSTRTWLSPGANGRPALVRLSVSSHAPSERKSKRHDRELSQRPTTKRIA